MIFVGEGALLWRAVQHTRDNGLPVDLVCGPASDSAAAAQFAVQFLATTDVNAVASELMAACTDGLLWSLNNRMIFRAPVLSTPIRVLNIHHGPLPAYRGMPEVALMYAMLRGEREFAATLHHVDEGIDTGHKLAVEPYPIGPEEPYHVVLRRGLRVCHQLFERCLPFVTADPGWPGDTAPSAAAYNGRYFGHTALNRLAEYREHPEYARATDLGFFAGYLPQLAAALA
ncbi:methionyl-tRNA formyltransferase [Streptomyces sp. 2231.1]|uniref:formyltransferase family protein n=1 Tax=Streptomyces sp. 2231.1 TaxID=1855347 RepID=UPI0008949702|nr:formyltransferase family protein [Streptomyces sp. 2231.1]SEE72639.1 methionyl-tRNA formyltransferase [Streptomyces sp. 2231.1]